MNAFQLELIGDKRKELQNSQHNFNKNEMSAYKLYVHAFWVCIFSKVRKTLLKFQILDLLFTMYMYRGKWPSSSPIGKITIKVILR